MATFLFESKRPVTPLELPSDIYSWPAMSAVLSDELVRIIRSALMRSWSRRTSECFSPDAVPSYGQCAPTAIVVNERFGGEILKTDGWSPEQLHFYNRIGGVRYDFTPDQFEMPHYSHEVQYTDIPSSIAEAITVTSAGQVEAMRAAFAFALSNESAG